MYTIVETAKANNVNVYFYLGYLLGATWPEVNRGCRNNAGRLLQWTFNVKQGKSILYLLGRKKAFCGLPLPVNLQKISRSFLNCGTLDPWLCVPHLSAGLLIKYSIFYAYFGSKKLKR
jgi:hypothetical protein